MREKTTTPKIVKEVARRMGCYGKDAREVLDHFAAVVRENLGADRKVQLAGLGVFYTAKSRGKIRVKFRPTRSLSLVGEGAAENGSRPVEGVRV